MDINRTKFVIDLLIFIDFVIIAISGFILWFILPIRSQGGGSSFIFTRFEWIMIHNWLSVLLIILLLVHLLLNRRWIRAMFKGR